jgi:hypothetical protein
MDIRTLKNSLLMRIDSSITIYNLKISLTFKVGSIIDLIWVDG